MGAGADACKATVKGLDQKIKAENGACGQGDIAVATDFTELNFSDNIGVEMGAGEDACKATIKGLDQQIQHSAKNDCQAAANFADTPFTHLNFADNIEASMGAGADACKATIKGMNQRIDGTANALIAGSDTFTDEDFSRLTFSDNIGVDQNGCTYTIKGLDQKIAANGNCSTNVVGNTDFTTLTFGSGLYVNGANGDYRIDKKLTFVDANGSTLTNTAAKITAGCGISVTAGGGGCDVQISLDKDASPGAANDVQVVKDICCSGSGLNVIYKTLRFTSCGLFSGVVNEGSC